jgi:hypothetical protein
MTCGGNRLAEWTYYNTVETRLIRLGAIPIVDKAKRLETEILLDYIQNIVYFPTINQTLSVARCKIDNATGYPP